MLYGAKHRTSFVNILSIQVSVMVISHVKSSVICPRTNLMMRTVLYRASTTWNTLAFSIRLTKSRHSFKYLLKKTLMNPQWLAIKKHSWVQESTATRYHIDIKKYIEEHGHTYTGSHFLSKSDNSTIQCPCSLFSKRSLAVGPHSLSGSLTEGVLVLLCCAGPRIHPNEFCLLLQSPRFICLVASDGSGLGGRRRLTPLRG